MKRGYYAHNSDYDQGGLAIVAPSVREAKKIAWKSGEFVYGDTGWLDITVRWVRNANIDGLPDGIVQDSRDALIRGMYCGLAGYPCDACGEESDVVSYRGRALCERCTNAEAACSD